MAKRVPPGVPAALCWRCLFLAVVPVLASCTISPTAGRSVSPWSEVTDVKRIPQTLSPLVERASAGVVLSAPCREQLLAEFRTRYFSPWTSATPFYHLEEMKRNMQQVAGGRWFGANRRPVERHLLAALLRDCALETFPSRNDRAVAVSPAHLRGLPTEMPLFAKREDYPFDMLAYPQVKLNEPLRVLHASSDGVWLFVESPYSTGWLPAREVALVDAETVRCFTEGELLVLLRDFQKVSDGRGGSYRAKIGTLFPLAGRGPDGWEVLVASRGDDRCAVLTRSVLSGESAAPFPVPFTGNQLALLGNQLLGQPYGWGELYGLRDCSAMLRDFFLPFGIWLPRTSRDQIDSVPKRQLPASPGEKEDYIIRHGVPFLTLLYKRGHVMLYAGTDEEGRALVFHSAWSVKLSDERVHYLGRSMITTLEPGRELKLFPGSSLLERTSTMAVITDRFGDPPR